MRQELEPEVEATEAQLGEPEAPPTPTSPPHHPLLGESEAETERQSPQGQHTIWVTLAEEHREGQMVEVVWQEVVLLIKPPDGTKPGGKFRAALPGYDGNGRKLEWKE